MAGPAWISFDVCQPPYLAPLIEITLIRPANNSSSGTDAVSSASTDAVSWMCTSTEAVSSKGT